MNFLWTGIFKLIMTHKKLGMTKETMANKVIPFLVPLRYTISNANNNQHRLINLIKILFFTKQY